MISATDSAWEARRRIRVPGLRDNACKAAVERALTDLDGFYGCWWIHRSRGSSSTTW